MKLSGWFVIGFLTMAVIGVIWWISIPPEVEIRTSLSAVDAMSGDTEGYLRADGPREFVFPDDHGAHEGFKTEWWYYTGNLFTGDGRQFGYQFTIFRNQLNPPAEGVDTVTEESGWSTDQFYLGHFALSDVENKNHIYEERSSRGAIGLAGARAVPYRIWLEDWEVQRVGGESGSDPRFPVRLKAKMVGGAAIDLQITPAKPLVLQGDRGYDQKGSTAGNASYYLSFTRMDTKGTLKINDQLFEVSGHSWMDHEWSTSALDEDQKGWDWFSIQLSNGYDLMYYQLRLKDGSVSRFKAVTLVDPAGEKVPIDQEDATLEVLDHWESPHSKSSYPSQWKLTIPRVDLSLDINTVFPDQEMDVSVRYYEGAVAVAGTMNGEEISGHGFIEMTGYEGK
ncbi:hypothetical protein KUV50_10930 [Membranicola marinus]|uniref:AttH domain-containing protein n=1 Tax=Membranihabitans marinus TaxID=1227546 RepID=A0A953L9A9_9BACT|nr:lipocalin-like domain-containing protein [Membranihabitans marinus]MBY5958650.1 hypothetical protein [Membranihabitans marinus]